MCCLGSLGTSAISGYGSKLSTPNSWMVFLLNMIISVGHWYPNFEPNPSTILIQIHSVNQSNHSHPYVWLRSQSFSLPCLAPPKRRQRRKGSTSSSDAWRNGPEDRWQNGMPKPSHPEWGKCRSCMGGFLKQGYPQIIHFNGIFHEINHPAMGVPDLLKPPYVGCIKYIQISAWSNLHAYGPSRTSVQSSWQVLKANWWMPWRAIVPWLWMFLACLGHAPCQQLKFARVSNLFNCWTMLTNPSNCCIINLFKIESIYSSLGVCGKTMKTAHFVYADGTLKFQWVWDRQIWRGQ